MALNTYNNNQDNRPSVNVYTPMTFANPDSKVQPTRLSISYFNRVMQLAIAQKIGNGTTDEYAQYNNDNQVKVYISYRSAKLLHDGILKMLDPNSGINNICIETKNGLLKVSNGVEYGSETFCISISYADNNGHVSEAIYQLKNNDQLAYNYSDGNFSIMTFPELELNTILMCLEQYYEASSYAIASTIRESMMYRDRAIYDTINAIANKVGAKTPNNTSPNSGSFSNRTFLQNNSGNTYSGGSSGGMNGVPKEYNQSSFDDIVSSMS